MNTIINKWTPGNVDISVILITLNEGHNLEKVLHNLNGWAKEVYILDSFSIDNTVDIALDYGVKIFQRKFDGFGNQWNAALNFLPIRTKWVMKLDPDELLSINLKSSIEKALLAGNFSGIIIKRRLWFLNKPLPVIQKILRIWRNNTCRFTDVSVNEHPIVEGKIIKINGYLEHFDSPSLDHWITKQNEYTTKEAENQFLKFNQGFTPRIFGNNNQRMAWLKKNFWKFPFRYQILFLYHYFYLGSFMAGKVGLIWSHLRVEVYRSWEYKFLEMRLKNNIYEKYPKSPGKPDSRVKLLND